ncbi:MAG TPA: hypothetical protein VGH23_11025 [Rhizomicrobium sp.]|jgi:hypothetical protein
MAFGLSFAVASPGTWPYPLYAMQKEISTLPEKAWRPYAEVRTELLQQGWKPFAAAHADGDDFCHDSDRLCQKYPELLWCYLAGRPGCHLGFYKTTPMRYRVVLVDGQKKYWRVAAIFEPDRQFIQKWFHRKAGEER